MELFIEEVILFEAHHLFHKHMFDAFNVFNEFSVNRFLEREIYILI